MYHLLHLHESQVITMPMMTHRPGATSSAVIDLHLGQKPKLGGGTPTIHSSTYHIFFGTLYIHVSLSFLDCSCSYFYFPKHKKTKNISVVSLCLSFKFSSFGLLYFLFSVCSLKNPKIFCFVCFFPPILVATFENPKIFVVLLRFCKVCCRV
jgi:hypothetical protein